jgi:hypothetical protein
MDHYKAVFDRTNGPKYYKWAVEDTETEMAVAWVEDKQTARLFAAASDLLEVTRGLHNALSRLIDKHDPDSIEAEWLSHSHEVIVNLEGKK